jgi:drug/metabolite transporter (DMT)-like permease
MLALTGVTVMVGRRWKGSSVGVTLALASALLYSIYLPALEYVQEGVPAMFATFLLILGAAVSFVLAALFAGELFLPRATPVWANIGLLAVISSVIAFSALIKGLSVLGPVRTAIIATVEAFLHGGARRDCVGTQLGPAIIVGCALIAAAILVIEWSSTLMTTTA